MDLPQELLIYILLNSNRSISKEVIVSETTWNDFLQAIANLFELKENKIKLFNSLGGEVDDLQYLENGETLFLCKEEDENIYSPPKKNGNSTRTTLIFSYNVKLLLNG